MRVIISALLATLLSTVSAFAGDPRQVTTIPTLSEWGMIAMVSALGVIGAIALRKRLTTKVG
jgi:hypothetical protein